MKESLSTYAKLIPFAIKNKRVLEFINLKWQKDSDKWKRKRQAEYYKNAITPEQALNIIFPNKNFKTAVFQNLENHINKFIENKKKEKFPSVENPYPVEFGLDRSLCRLLFFLCEFLHPDYVIETGVANGFSSSYILLGLDFIKKGKLISIDYMLMPWHTKNKVGMAIPDFLKKRQNLIIGKSLIELKKVFKDVNSIDVFIHDSSHTFNNMMAEYKIAWPHLKKGGFLISDDVSQNDAFLNFADLVQKKPIIITKNSGSHFGLIRK